jgi:4-diphosphocytidyl-2C-methyl-D-erythritol kinase
MSGSGSAVFGLFTASEAAAQAIEPFTRRDGWRAWLTTTAV